ncbi:hypothetical protein [Roseicyclus marinus]|uniref:hypothetical protein n=1 Tax=Roseicyclus marinus TaxID=2161673 RepID=UPI00240F5031|nr:hypothetical protein [Roseicyclus marinus]MDG3040451.1 hypothetical protein [Roseicyclus marinus]
MSIDHLVSMLGGWPEYFGTAEIRHGEALLEHLRRRKFVDELAFGIVVRYAVHRAAFDRISWEIAEAEHSEQAETDGHQFLSAAEQQRAYHANKLASIEKQLLGTPYERAKAGQDVQTSFMDNLLSGAPTDAPAGDNVRSFPFQPISRPGHG